jgi:hypothetical protein
MYYIITLQGDYITNSAGIPLIAPALATLFLHPHALALAILRMLNLDPHVHNLLVNARCDTLNASGVSDSSSEA